MRKILFPKRKGECVHDDTYRVILKLVKAGCRLLAIAQVPVIEHR